MNASNRPRRRNLLAKEIADRLGIRLPAAQQLLDEEFYFDASWERFTFDLSIENIRIPWADVAERPALLTVEEFEDRDVRQMSYELSGDELHLQVTCGNAGAHDYVVSDYIGEPEDHRDLHDFLPKLAKLLLRTKSYRGFAAVSAGNAYSYAPEQRFFNLTNPDADWPIIRVVALIDTGGVENPDRTTELKAAVREIMVQAQAGLPLGLVNAAVVDGRRPVVRSLEAEQFTEQAKSLATAAGLSTNAALDAIKEAEKESARRRELTRLSERPSSVRREFHQADVEVRTSVITFSVAGGLGALPQRHLESLSEAFVFGVPGDDRLWLFPHGQHEPWLAWVPERPPLRVATATWEPNTLARDDVSFMVNLITKVGHEVGPAKNSIDQTEAVRGLISGASGPARFDSASAGRGGVVRMDDRPTWVSRKLTYRVLPDLPTRRFTVDPLSTSHACFDQVADCVACVQDGTASRSALADAGLRAAPLEPVGHLRVDVDATLFLDMVVPLSDDDWRTLFEHVDREVEYANLSARVRTEQYNAWLGLSPLAEDSLPSEYADFLVAD